MARVAVIGQSGTGKSFGAGAVIERILDPNHPDNPGQTFDIAVHFDPEDEEKGLSDADHDPLYRRLDVDAELARNLEWMKVLYNHRRIRVVPDMTDDAKAELYGVICGAVFELCKDVVPDLTALVSGDEIGSYVTQTSADKRVLTVQTRGRKYGVETVHVMQRPQQAHTEMISQCDRRMYFRVNDDNDLGKLSGQAGFNVNRIPNLNGRGLKELEDREVVIENVGTGDIIVESTNDWRRIRPHYSGDDGLIDDVLPV